MKALTTLYLSLLSSVLATTVFAQGASVKARPDATQITVGDQIKFFIEATHQAGQSKLQWADIPDTFHSLEVVDKGKIDTVRQGDIFTYRQRLLITGFDSGSFQIPAFRFTVIPKNGKPYSIQTDSFQVLVQTVPVDTTKPFRDIKDILPVKSTLQDYLWLIIGGIILLVLLATVIIYFRKNKKTATPLASAKKPVEALHERTLRLLNELDNEKLWQAGRIKEYYVQLTEILRNYIEQRFHTPALELTTDELLQQAKAHPEMRLQYEQLATILYTADLAKFAKAQPLPHEHTHAIELTRQFVMQTKPVETNLQPQS